MRSEPDHRDEAVDEQGIGYSGFIQCAGMGNSWTSFESQVSESRPQTPIRSTRLERLGLVEGVPADVGEHGAAYDESGDDEGGEDAGPEAHAAEGNEEDALSLPVRLMPA